MAFLDKAGLQTLTNKLVQGDAIKVASSRGYTVKTVIDNITRECSDVENPQTMTLEDETGHFMIGKGKDIDVSGDIEVGKMAFGFKGRTAQNLSENRNIDSKNWRVPGPNVNLFKLNTFYTFIGNVSIPEGKSLLLSRTSLKINKSGFVKQKFSITHPEYINDWWLYLHGSGAKENFIRISDFLILEGDWIDKETPPCFMGIKSSFETEEERKILHTGKNLWKWGDPTRFAQYTRTFSEPFMLAGHTYTISHGNITQYFSPDDVPNIRFASINGELKNIHFRGEPIVFTPKEDVKDVIIYSNGYNWAGSTGKFATIENFQIEEGRGATEYAPYIKEEKTVELNEPLRGLPYGAYDEITEDGKLIRRLKKVVFSGGENWEMARNDSAVTERFILIQEDKKNVVFGHDFINDSFNIVYSNAGSSADDEYMFSYVNKTFQIRINKTKISNGGLAGFKQWLAKNPVTVIYELEKEEIVKINQIKINISQNNKIDIPSTIAPITTYKVPLNRAAQIDNSIKTIQELKQRIALLEQAYDNHFLESQYKLSLLKLEHQIESEEN